MQKHEKMKKDSERKCRIKLHPSESFLWSWKDDQGF